MYKLAKVLQSQLRKRHLELRKAPGEDWPALPVFSLAVERLMQLRGPCLRFIQVGANDGVYGDPLRPYIVRHNWHGILCEPQIDVFQRLKVNYREHSKNLIFENVAVGASQSELAIYRVPERLSATDDSVPYELTVTSFNASAVARQTGVPIASLERVAVPVTTLDDLMRRHSLENLDVLQIDVEGFDLEVLRGLSLDKHRPRLVQFEHGQLRPAQVSEAVSLLGNAGYLIHYGGRSTDTVAMTSDLFDAS